MKLTNFLLLSITFLLMSCTENKEKEISEDASSRGDIYESSSADAIDMSDQPEWLAERLEWFEDQKIGILFSWGQCVVWGGHQSWCISPDAPWGRPDDWKPWIENNKDLPLFTKAYFNLYKEFNPVNFNPDKWAELTEYAGVKYVGITTKHHDGYCLFDTKTTDFKITSKDSPFHNNPRSNLTKEIFDAFRNRGLGISCYFSKSDWYSPYYWNPDFPITDRNVNYNTRENPEIWSKFKDYTYRQIEELMRDYGKVDILWLDGGQVRPPSQDIDMPKIAKMARSYQDKLIIVDRTVGGKYENVITPEQHIPAEPLEGTWEVCATIQRQGWTWRPNTEYRSTKELLHMLIDIISKGGNLFLGIGPNPEGELDPETVIRLREIGDWMAINSEAIHNTRRWVNFSEGENIRFTRTKDWKYLYVHSLDLPSKELRLKTVRPIVNSEIKLLGYSSPLKWRIENEELVIKIPESLLNEENQLDKNAWVFKVEAIQPALTPTITPQGAIFDDDGIIVNLKTETKNADIYYTLDGTIPNKNSFIFEEPIIIDETSTLKVVAYKNGVGYSTVASGYFVEKGDTYKKITLVSKSSPNYPGKGVEGLNDGIKANDDYQHSNWLGFEENDFEVIIDLGEKKSIQKITASFLQDQQKWIFYPKKVEYYCSSDGEDYVLVSEIKQSITEDNKATSNYFISNIENEKARYVKVIAKNVGTCPKWHKGSGGNAWLFIDEITIQ